MSDELIERAKAYVAEMLPQTKADWEPLPSHFANFAQVELNRRERLEHAVLSDDDMLIKALTGAVDVALDQIPPLRDRAEKAERRLAIAMKGVDDEPELPGPMVDEMWEAIKERVAAGDREAVEEILRITVRLTKDGIRERIAQQIKQQIEQEGK